LHPDNANKSYLKIKVTDLSEEMRALFKYWSYLINKIFQNHNNIIVII
jgi:hypothetical protein